MPGQRVGIARQLLGGVLGKDLTLGSHGTVDAVQSSLGDSLGRLLEIEIQLLEDLAEYSHGRHHNLLGQAAQLAAEEKLARIHGGSRPRQFEEMTPRNGISGFHDLLKRFFAQRPAIPG